MNIFNEESNTMVDVDVGIVIQALEYKLRELQAQYNERKADHLKCLLAERMCFLGFKKYTAETAKKENDTCYPPSRLSYWCNYDEVKQLLNACRLHSGDVVRLSVHDANMIHDMVVKYVISAD